MTNVLWTFFSSHTTVAVYSKYHCNVLICTSLSKTVMIYILKWTKVPTTSNPMTKTNSWDAANSAHRQRRSPSSLQVIRRQVRYNISRHSRLPSSSAQHCPSSLSFSSMSSSMQSGGRLSTRLRHRLWITL